MGNFDSTGGKEDPDLEKREQPEQKCGKKGRSKYEISPHGKGGPEGVVMIILAFRYFFQ